MNTDTAVTMLLAMGVAAVVSFLSTPMVKNLAYKVGAIDVPKDNRRMHKVPIPRLGGLAIFLAFLLSVLVFANIDRQMQGILLGATMIVVLGVMDDIMALNALPKLIVQIVAAGIAVYHGCVIQFVSNPNVFSSLTYLNLGWWSYPITIIWIVAITNAVNLIDGLDGLAVGVSAISTASITVIDGYRRFRGLPDVARLRGRCAAGECVHSGTNRVNIPHIAGIRRKGRFPRTKQLVRMKILVALLLLPEDRLK